MYRINAPKVIHETIDGETVLVNLDSGNYYSLDGAGADVWGLLERGAPVEGIIGWVAGRYTGDRANIEKAVCQLIEALQREELILPDTTRGPENSADCSGLDKASPGEQLRSFVPPALHKYSDMQDLLLLDPIHEVDEAGWPNVKPDKD
jgi:hypothetical protein